MHSHRLENRFGLIQGQIEYPEPSKQCKAATHLKCLAPFVLFFWIFSSSPNQRCSGRREAIAQIASPMMKGDVTYTTAASRCCEVTLQSLEASQ